MDVDRWLARREATMVIVACLVVAAVALAPGFYNGHIIGNSSAFNASWAEGFASQLAHGTLYPRYLPEMNQGFGSPVFYFYAPLPFYLAAPFVWLFGDGSRGVIAATALILALSGMAAYALLRDVAERRTSLLLAVVFMLLPYHFILDIWTRGALGEQMAFIFLPLGLRALLRLQADDRQAAVLALATAGQTLSHLPSTLIFDTVIGGMALWLGFKSRSLHLPVTTVLAGMAGTMAAGLYVVPAIASHDFIRSDFWGIYPPEYYYIGQFHRAFDFMILAAVIPSTLVFWLASRQLWRAGTFEARAWIVMGGATLFLVSPLAIPLWRHASLFKFVQFPWRTLLVFELAVVVLAAMAFTRSAVGAQRLARLLILGIVMLAGFSVTLRQQSDPDKSAQMRTSEEDTRIMLAEKADALEYLPACWDFPLSSYEGPPSTVELIQKLKMQPPPPQSLPRFYYPFLRATAGGEPVAIRCLAGTGLIALQEPALRGLEVRLEAAALPIERPAGLVSLAGVAAVAGIYVFGRRRWSRRAIAGRSAALAG